MKQATFFATITDASDPFSVSTRTGMLRVSLPKPVPGAGAGAGVLGDG